MAKATNWKNRIVGEGEQVASQTVQLAICKSCRVCGASLSLEEFPIAKGCKDGHANECLECKRKRNREYMRQRRVEQPDTLREQLGRYRSHNREYQRERYKELKAEVIARYGGRCACCGESALAFLTIDHVHNDGNAHRSAGQRYSGVFIYRWLKARGFPDDGRYQVLCYNCNCAKQHDKEGHRAAHPNAILIDGGD